MALLEFVIELVGIRLAVFGEKAHRCCDGRRTPKRLIKVGWRRLLVLRLPTRLLAFGHLWLLQKNSGANVIKRGFLD
jgi:hypothetical protein